MNQETHFDKLLLTCLILVFGGIHLWLTLKGLSDTTFSHAFDGFGGALLGLITGMRLGQNMANGNGNGNGNGVAKAPNVPAA
jgi:hypothetical protein